MRIRDKLLIKYASHKIDKWYSKHPKKMLKECSEDKKNSSFMVESEIKAIDFDDVKDKYCESWERNDLLRSNDALYRKSKNDEFYFIEFKNGNLKTRKGEKEFALLEKIYDSLFILRETGLRYIPYKYLKINYILVYNEEKNPINNSNSKSARHLAGISKKKFVRFGIDKFENYLFNQVDTVTEKEFEEQFLSRWQ